MAGGSRSASSRGADGVGATRDAFAFALQLSVARRISGRCAPRTIFVAVKRIGAVCAPCKSTCRRVTRLRTSARPRAMQPDPRFTGGLAALTTRISRKIGGQEGPRSRVKLTLHYRNWCRACRSALARCARSHAVKRCARAAVMCERELRHSRQFLTLEWPLTARNVASRRLGGARCHHVM